MGSYFQPQVWGDKVLNPLRDSVAKYKQSQREAKADERYQQQLAWQQKVQGWKEKDYERQETARLRLKASNLSLSDASSGYLNKSWDADGYKGTLRSVQDDVGDYVSYMKARGYNPTPQEIQAATTSIEQARQQYIAGATEGLNQRIADWENKNKDIKGHLGQDDWNPFNNKDYENARKEYLESIGATELYSQLSGVGGQHGATQATGLTPDDFKKSAMQLHPMAIAAGGAATGYGGYKLYDWLDKEIKSGGTSPQQKKHLEHIRRLANQISGEGTNVKNTGKVLASTKAQGYLNNLEDLVKDYKAKYPDAAKGLNAALKGSKFDSFKTVKKFGIPAVGYLGASQLGKAIGGDVGQETGEAGAATYFAIKEKAPQSFWKFAKNQLAKRAPSMAAKAGILSAADGPLPLGEILALGFTLWEFADIWNAWNQKNK